ncbi:MAG: hypothetical protein ACTSU9_01485 [Promethearchaeota archaeon]
MQNKRILDDLLSSEPDITKAIMIDAENRITYMSKDWNVEGDIFKVISNWNEGCLDSISMAGVKYTMLQCTPERFAATASDGSGNIIGARDDERKILVHVKQGGNTANAYMQLTRTLIATSSKGLQEITQEFFDFLEHKEEKLHKLDANVLQKRNEEKKRRQEELKRVMASLNVSDMRDVIEEEFMRFLDEKEHRLQKVDKGFMKEREEARQKRKDELKQVLDSLNAQEMKGILQSELMDFLKDKENRLEKPDDEIIKLRAAEKERRREELQKVLESIKERGQVTEIGREFMEFLQERDKKLKSPDKEFLRAREKEKMKRRYELQQVWNALHEKEAKKVSTITIEAKIETNYLYDDFQLLQLKHEIEAILKRTLKDREELNVKIIKEL